LFRLQIQEYCHLLLVKIVSQASLTTVPSSESEPSGISSALNESLEACYDSLDDAGRQNLMFSAMASRDHSLLQSLFNLQKTKGTFTVTEIIWQTFRTSQ
jgi:hypothetical protein